MPYWATAASLSAVTAHRGLFPEVSPFWYALRKGSAGTGVRVEDHGLDGGATHASVLAALHAARVRVIPTVTDSTSAGYLASQLADPRRRAAVVSALTAVVLRDGVDGIDLDLEGFAFHDPRASRATTRPLWVALVTELHAALAKHHRLLTATIPASDAPGSAGGYALYDAARIAPYVHAIRLMAYDYHVSAAGPIAPLPWVRQVLARAVAGVPASKVWLGVPAYGRSWVTGTSGTCPTGTPLTRATLAPAEAAALAASLRLQRTWDPATAERTFSYTQSWSGPAAGGTARTSCTVTRTVWYDDTASITARAAAAKDAGIAGIALWSLDDVPSSAYPALAQALGRGANALTTARPVAAARVQQTATPATSTRSRVSAATPSPATDPAAADEAQFATVQREGDVVAGLEASSPTAAPTDPAQTATPSAVPEPVPGDGAVAAPRAAGDPVRSLAPALGAAVLAAALVLLVALRALGRLSLPALPSRRSTASAAALGRHARPDDGAPSRRGRGRRRIR